MYELLLRASRRCFLFTRGVYLLIDHRDCADNVFAIRSSVSAADGTKKKPADTVKAQQYTATL